MSQEWRGGHSGQRNSTCKGPRGKPAPGLLVRMGMLVHRPTHMPVLQAATRGSVTCPPSRDQKAMACGPKHF